MIPELRIARANHSSCTLGSGIYVFCGIIMGDTSKLVDSASVEVFDLSLASQNHKWTVLYYHLLTPRAMPSVTPIGLN